MRWSQAQGGDKSRQTHQSLQRVLDRIAFMQGLLEGRAVDGMWMQEDKLDC